MPMKRRKNDWSDRHLRRRIKRETDAEWREIIAETNCIEMTSEEDNESPDEFHYLDLGNESSDGLVDFDRLYNTDDGNTIEDGVESECELCKGEEQFEVENCDTLLDYDTCSELSTETEDEYDVHKPEDPVKENREVRSEKVKHSLTLLALAFGIPLIVVTFILLILRNNTDLLLPRDSRTLLKTPRKSSLESMGSGQYSHFGLSKAVGEIWKEYKRRGIEKTELHLTVNIDGLPLFKSSEKSLWLILCSERNMKNVYIVGMYWGYEKPTNPNEFLKKFVDEAVELFENGFQAKKRKIAVKFHALICDAPAKSMVLNTKGHSGFDSCSKCNIRGQYEYLKREQNKKKGGRVCFPGVKHYRSRTDVEFQEGRYIGRYQHGHTELLRIPEFKGVTGVPLDCMHLVLLGVMKKLIHLWLHGPRGEYRLSSQEADEIDARLAELKETMPREFVRRLRSTRKFKFWKATEFRTFLLYTGPVVLKGVMKKKVFKNFMLLHSAIKILVDPTFVKLEANISNAESCLQKFVRTYQKIYGKVYVTHNVHNLLHLASDVRMYGHLDSFSAFKFENHMTFVKRQVRMYNQPLQQISRRYAEFAAVDFMNENFRECRMSLKKSHSSGPIDSEAPTSFGQYHQFDNDVLSIRCEGDKDNCVRLRSGVTVVVKNILDCGSEGVYIVGRQHEAMNYEYVRPNISAYYGICKVAESGTLKSWKISEVMNKVWRMKLKGDVMVFPLLNGENGANIRIVSQLFPFMDILTKA